jgi:hypothetical protein
VERYGASLTVTRPTLWTLSRACPRQDEALNDLAVKAARFQSSRVVKIAGALQAGLAPRGFS